ncbi:MAG: uncharacterized protein KVP18_003696 [Porospora cf. gigantea A]|uniref:uncharacterized protein n=1 Tax=Porospora cf. gigantea A TaxID=2853593 RepID=UPI003559D42A|nr:MAG: hypothetical protein KVP18_003696 [Porospora cf. gigantea A]
MSRKRPMDGAREAPTAKRQAIDLTSDDESGEVLSWEKMKGVEAVLAKPVEGPANSVEGRVNPVHATPGWRALTSDPLHYSPLPVPSASESPDLDLFTKLKEERVALDVKDPSSYLLVDEEALLKRKQANDGFRTVLKNFMETRPPDVAEATTDFIKLPEKPWSDLPWMQFYSPSSADSVAEFKKLSFFDRFHEECVALCKWLEPTPDEQLIRMRIHARIQVICKFLWPSSQVEVFGSYYNGLYLPHGDIDVCVCHVNTADPLTCLKALTVNLYSTGVASHIELITKAKVPIIKMIDAESNLPVDVSFNQESALTTSQFVRDQMESNRWFRPMVLILKLFLRQRNLSETYRGGVGSYLLSVMVVSFLQQSVSMLKTGHCNLGSLLTAFFHLYGVDFMYKTTGISVLHGGRYFSKAQRRMVHENLSLFAVESPLDPTTDLGKNSYNIETCRQVFRNSFITILELHKAFDPSSPRPILRSILKVKDPLITNRRSTVRENIPPIGLPRPVPMPSADVVESIRNFMLATGKLKSGSGFVVGHKERRTRRVQSFKTVETIE